MAAHRKSLAELEASGATAKDPQRFRTRTEAPAPKEPIKGAPKHLDAEHKKVWKEFVSQAPEGVLGSCDATFLEIAVRLTVRMQKGLMEKTSEYVSLGNVLSKLGLNPSDRKRFDGPVAKPAADDALSELD